MKKWIRTVCAGALLAGALTVSAFAADFTSCADHLKEMNLFQGTGDGYALDRAPTRGEAAAMLVRLLGREQQAKALDYTAPFTDLAGWQKPYVQYLYEHDLTRGVSETSFAPEDGCTAQMYAAFLLRALGYSEQDGDFTYRSTLDFAEKIGLYDAYTVDEADFRRGHLAAASYTALSITPKDGQGTLLDQLVRSGAVERTAAAPYQKLFSDYARYRSATAGMDSLHALSLRQELKVDAERLAMRSQETISVDLAASVSLTERVATMSAPGAKDKTFTAESYTAGGFRYLKQDGVRSRRALTAEQQRLAFAGYARLPVAMIETMSVSPAGSYTFTYDAQGLVLLDEMLDAARAAVGGFDGMEISGLTVTQSAAGGKIASQKVGFSFAADDIAGTVQSETKLLATDDAVAVTAPSNLEQYPLVQ
ncbi:MAG: S-layer homology domain-containing protein [Agathobaculum sp.]|jgi:hypothetical protein|uniref:S-layer homology domain-containing protein n=1 Tax=Agathobaculum sp. TaxID=2048138 RepID=UPI003D9466AF